MHWLVRVSGLRVSRFVCFRSARLGARRGQLWLLRAMSRRRGRALASALAAAVWLACLACGLARKGTLSVPDAEAWATRVGALNASVGRGNVLGGAGWYEPSNPPECLPLCNPVCAFSCPAGAARGTYAELAFKHVPELRQVGTTRFAYVHPHIMLWQANGTIKHAIAAVFVLDESGRAVYYGESSSDNDHIETWFEYDAAGRPGARLTPYAFCNRHGGWRGAALAVVDPATLGLAVCLAQQPNASRGSTADGSGSSTSTSAACASTTDRAGAPVGGAVVVSSADRVDFRSALLDAAGRVLSAASAGEATQVQVTLRWPAGSFMGLGFAAQMAPSDLVMCAETGGQVACHDMWVSARELGPRTDASLGGQNDVLVVASSVVDGIASATVRKPLRPSDVFDVAISALRQDVIVAYGAVPRGGGNLSAGAGAGYYHGMRRRFRYAGLSLALPAANGAQACSSTVVGDEHKVVHGVMMLITWSVIIVTGAVVARYERHNAWWIHVHRFMQTIGTMITFPGFLLTGTWARGASWAVSAHRVIGITILACSWAQALCGSLLYQSSEFSLAFCEWAACSSALSPGAKQHLQHLTDVHGSREVLAALYQSQRLEEEKLAPGAKMKLAETRTELDQALLRFSLHETLPGRCCSRRLMLRVATRGKVSLLRPMHRAVGLVLPAVAIFQVCLGTLALEPTDTVRNIILAWLLVVTAYALNAELWLQLRRRGITMGDVLSKCWRRSESVGEGAGNGEAAKLRAPGSPTSPQSSSGANHAGPHDVGDHVVVDATARAAAATSLVVNT